MYLLLGSDNTLAFSMLFVCFCLHLVCVLPSEFVLSCVQMRLFLEAGWSGHNTTILCECAQPEHVLSIYVSRIRISMVVDPKGSKLSLTE